MAKSKQKGVRNKVQRCISLDRDNWAFIDDLSDGYYGRRSQICNDIITEARKRIKRESSRKPLAAVEV